MKEANEGSNGTAYTNGAAVTAAGNANSKAKTNNGKTTKAAVAEEASFTETMSFAFDCGGRTKLLFVIGFIAGVLNGLVYPILAYLFSTSFSSISTASTNGLSQVRHLAYTFMVVGSYALVVATIQTWAFEIVAYQATQNFRLQWFRALLRQDTAYFDVYNVGGIANQVGPSANKYRRGLGRKFGEGIQFLTTGVGGIIFAFYMSWRVALVVLGVVPFVTISALMVLQLNQTKGARAASAYRTAGSVAYSAVSAIKTVFSLNGVKTMIDKYAEATQEAYKQATGVLLKQGFANGSMLGSFMLLYCILTLFGTFLLYRDVQDEGCDPSGGIDSNETCDSSGPEVFGAMLGVAFAAQGVSQFGNFSEAFSQARVSAHGALQAIRRKPGAPEEIIYKTAEEDDIGSTTHSKKSGTKAGKASSHGEMVEGDKIIKAILPKYEIDSTSDNGLKPQKVSGHIAFKNVHFTYPTRPREEVLHGVSTEINPGQTVAFVGPSGSGKSTIVALLERFYDPKIGTIELDGLDLKEINVASLRGMIGYVGQEPKLFSCSIRQNIQYGNPNATFEEIQEACKLANAHDFIMSFPDGYETQCGDAGSSQLSGGQKQRVAIARVLVGNPKIFILDEATAALDSESELIVQEALDNIVQTKRITTVIIAHRLSTIRNCDIINVLVYGEIAESGTHDELMLKNGYYKKLVDKQDGNKNNSGNNSAVTSRVSSEVDLKEMAAEAVTEEKRYNRSLSKVPHISFKKVKFAYPTRPKKVIFDGFSLDIETGSTVALVGPSGGGKSTTVGLIERFYDPIGGSVRYQGVDIRSLNVHWYRDQIGYVGQEPTLFNDTIANNIAYGFPGASREQIQEAARQANAHDFIMEFDEGYDTMIGEGSQLSGGQKQRVAIARALVKKPKLLILDEATSALDNQSEAIVQAAIDKLLESREQTCVVIAHRLSTIRGADKIAVISEGKVVEQGTHDELLELPHGRYKRLFESSRRDATISAVALKSGQIADFGKDGKASDDGEADGVDWEALHADEEKKAFSARRAISMATQDKAYLIVGAFGAAMAGAVFPMWGLAFSAMISNMFVPVFKCADNNIPTGPPEAPLPHFDNCQDYWDFTADDMRQKSFRVAGYWAAIMAGCVVGNVSTVYGFGMASERLNKRVRDSSFAALLRQEVSYFDKRSVGSITSQLQDDAARIQAFSGEPVRSFIIAVSSVVTGLILSFVHMWQFALLAIACIPLMGFATAIHMQNMLGADEGDVENTADGSNSPGGIIVETLLNIRTVSALTLEKERLNDYERALVHDDPNMALDAFTGGLTSGISMFIQQWINALQMWFGGYLLFTFPQRYDFHDFLISNFAVLFALFGLGSAFQDISDRKEVEKSAGRVFYLLDRKSAIDPLTEDGNKLEWETIEV